MNNLACISIVFIELLELFSYWQQDCWLGDGRDNFEANLLRSWDPSLSLVFVKLVRISYNLGYEDRN
jgi:hypothetical protein